MGRFNDEHRDRCGKVQMLLRRIVCRGRATKKCRAQKALAARAWHTGDCGTARRHVERARVLAGGWRVPRGV